MILIIDNNANVVYLRFSDSVPKDWDFIMQYNTK